MLSSDHAVLGLNLQKQELSISLLHMHGLLQTHTHTYTPPFAVSDSSLIVVCFCCMLDLHSQVMVVQNARYVILSYSTSTLYKTWPCLDMNGLMIQCFALYIIVSHLIISQCSIWSLQQHKWAYTRCPPLCNPFATSVGCFLDKFVPNTFSTCNSM